MAIKEIYITFEYIENPPLKKIIFFSKNLFACHIKFLDSLVVFFFIKKYKSLKHWHTGKIENYDRTHMEFVRKTAILGPIEVKG